MYLINKNDLLIASFVCFPTLFGCLLFRQHKMDTISTLAESGERSFIEYDASGKVKGENYMIDPESQEISDEFKRPPY